MKSTHTKYLRQKNKQKNTATTTQYEVDVKKENISLANRKQDVDF